MTDLISGKSVYSSCIPSYQMQTISSQLKIVQKGRFRRTHKTPFTVGTSYTTHNVGLLKQETAHKIKSLLLVVRNEELVDQRNIRQLRLLKQDIETCGGEAKRLLWSTQNKRRQDDYMDARRQHSPHSVSIHPRVRAPSRFNDDLQSIVQFGDQLQNILGERFYGHDTRSRTMEDIVNHRLAPDRKPVVDVKNVLEEKVDPVAEIMGAVKLEAMTHSTSNSYCSRKKKRKVKKRHVIMDEGGDAMEEDEAPTRGERYEGTGDFLNGVSPFLKKPSSLNRAGSFLSMPKLSSSGKHSEYSFRMKKPKVKRRYFHMETNEEDKEGENAESVLFRTTDNAEGNEEEDEEEEEVPKFMTDYRELSRPSSKRSSRSAGPHNRTHHEDEASSSRLAVD